MKYKIYDYDKSINLLEKVIYTVTFVFDWIYRILLEYAKIVLLVIVAIVSAQVISRKFIGISIRWSEEVALVLMVWMAFIAMAIGVERHLHIAIEMFANRLPARAQWIIGKVNDIATFLFGLVLLVHGANLVCNTMNSKLPATQWPAGIEYLMMPVGGFFIMYFSVLSLFGLSKYRHKDVEGDDIKEAQ